MQTYGTAWPFSNVYFHKKCLMTNTDDENWQYYIDSIPIMSPLYTYTYIYSIIYMHIWYYIIIYIYYMSIILYMFTLSQMWLDHGFCSQHDSPHDLRSIEDEFAGETQRIWCQSQLKLGSQRKKNLRLSPISQEVWLPEGISPLYHYCCWLYPMKTRVDSYELIP